MAEWRGRDLKVASQIPDIDLLIIAVKKVRNTGFSCDSAQEVEPLTPHPQCLGFRSTESSFHLKKLIYFVLGLVAVAKYLKGFLSLSKSGF